MLPSDREHLLEVPADTDLFTLVRCPLEGAVTYFHHGDTT